MSPRIKAVIFDCFGVIMSNGRLDELDQLSEDARRDFLRISAEADLGIHTEDETLALHGELLGLTPQELERKLAATELVYRNVLEYADTLQNKNIRTGLLSNISSRGRIEKRIWGAYGSTRYLNDFFHDITISSELGLAKPGPEIFNSALGRLGVRPEEAIFLDDSERHVIGAKAVGIQGIHFTNAPGELEKLQELTGVLITSA